MEASLACSFCGLPVPGRLLPVHGRAPHQSSESGNDEAAFCCYGCRFASMVTRENGDSGQAAWLLTRLGLAAFLSMTVMVISVYLYGRDIYGVNDVSGGRVTDAMTALARYASLLLASPVLFLLGLPLWRTAAQEWKRCGLSADVLIIGGVVAAFGYSYVSTLRGSGATYFETACMILVLVTLGRWLDATGKLKASDAIRALSALLPDKVQLIDGDAVREIAIDRVARGDVLLVTAGARVPVDGVITSGRALVDQQIVTGESEPVTRGEGDDVAAGCVAIDGALQVRAELVGRDSTIGRMAQMLEQAQQNRCGLLRSADRIAGVFIPLVIGIALLAAIGGWYRGGGGEAIMTALAVLLIACPCALGIATPMAIWVALGIAARRQVMIRNGEELERLARVDTICFDKTGTLTDGRARVAEIVACRRHSCDTDGRAERDAVMAVRLAAGSTHSLSQALVRHASAARDAESGIADSETSPAAAGAIVPHRVVPGLGIEGAVDGVDVLIGSAAFMTERAVSVDGPAQQRIDTALARGESFCCVAAEGELCLLVTFDETIRPEAVGAIDQLRRQGLRVLMLSGDHPARCARLAEELGIESYGGLRPEDKLAQITKWQRLGERVALVGDGLNDAPAMAAADVGIAMACGADLTREAAGICLLGESLCDLPWLVRLSRRCVRTVHVNLFWAFVYNTFGVALAFMGLLQPVMAAFAMVISSVLVIGNSLRLNRFGDTA